MTFVHPDYWLVYVPESTEDGPPELTALAPALVDRRTLGDPVGGLPAVVRPLG